jgi:hypothetical protein
VRLNRRAPFSLTGSFDQLTHIRGSDAVVVFVDAQVESLRRADPTGVAKSNKKGGGWHSQELLDPDYLCRALRAASAHILFCLFCLLYFGLSVSILDAAHVRAYV